MDFISNKDPQIKEMLSSIGIKNIEELFCDIPATLKLPRPSIDDGLSEYEGLRHMEKLAAKNSFPSFENYLGAGAYEHHVPALVNAICSKSEFLTSYTPYQAEASQGMLQAIFEYQSAICALTGMDVANASVYDGASACAEAALMALRHNKTRSKILVADSLHPNYKGVVEQYLKNQNGKIETIKFKNDGSLDLEDFYNKVDDNTAAVLFQSPNFFGVVEELKPFIEFAKSKGVLTIICANPIAYGLFSSAGELGADIAVGDCQPLGLSLSFGGPYVGYMACKQELVRQMPGRIVGETVDTKNRRGFVLTLQAREQHIRREKATSNICTNQALAALAALVGILWYGPNGLKELALTNYQRSNYLKNHLNNVKGLKVDTTATTFNEFVLTFEKPLEEVLTIFRKEGIEPGIELGRYYPSYKQSLLVAVTETKNKDQLDRYINVAKLCASKKGQL
ncbi:MAG: aminomethyl-transferring glycine dehydrogenase subunit GcvPA [Parachlamydiaceae bacterium]|nr:aminomethyl-transferring glycine dehydrogenase subunit GcvPA [Parachlamydiaceae bacterium]